MGGIKELKIGGVLRLPQKEYKLSVVKSTAHSVSKDLQTKYQVSGTDPEYITVKRIS